MWVWRCGYLIRSRSQKPEEKWQMIMLSDGQQSRTDVFWAELAPCDHCVQIYENDEVFLDSLEGFVADGLRTREGVIIIATTAHLGALERRLNGRGFEIDAARARDQYIALDAEETLAKFIVNGWPDDDLFNELVAGLIARAYGNGRRVRAFGEMVALLWARGHNAATVRLEYLWTRFCQTEALCLFCAYPRSGFTQDADASIREICAAHGKVLAGDTRAA